MSYGPYTLSSYGGQNTVPLQMSMSESPNTMTMLPYMAKRVFKL